MAKTRYIRFDYFSLVKTKFEMINETDSSKKVKKIVSEEIFDYIEFISDMNKKSISEREIYHNQEKIRIDMIRVDPKTEYGITHFTRLRDTNVPALTKEMVEELEDLGLDSNEYIAEGVSCLYDDELNIFMVQRNIYSVSPSGIEFYINYFNDNADEYVELRPVVFKNAFERGKGKNIYRSIDIKTADIKKNPRVLSMDNPISRAFKELSGLEGFDIEIKVKAARGKKEKLNKRRIEEILSDFQSEKKLLDKAEIGFKESDEAKVEKIDLLKGRIFTFLPFTVLPKKFLNPDVVETDMINIYSKKDGERSKILKNR